MTTKRLTQPDACKRSHVSDPRRLAEVQADEPAQPAVVRQQPLEDIGHRLALHSC
jgi:hypothetical protein